MSSFNKFLGGIGLCAVLTLAISACSGGASDSAPAGPDAASLETMDDIALTYTTFQPAESTGGRAITAFAEEVSERSGGKITIEPYFSGSLMPAEETLDGVGSGFAQLGSLMPLYFPQELPVNNWLLDMGSLPSDSYPHGILAGTAAIKELQASSEVLQQEWADHDARVLSVAQVDAGQDMLCTTPINTPADAQGLRVRTGGGAWIGEIEALGMVSVSMPLLEAYEALQRGVIDCVTAHPSTIVDYGLWEVAKHFVPVSMSAFNDSADIINLDTWNSLPPDAQAILTEAAHTMWTVEREGKMAAFSKFAREAPGEHGVVFHDPAPLNAVLTRYQEGVVDNLIANAPTAVADPQGFVDTYQGLLDKWQTRVTELIDVPLQPVMSHETFRESYASATGIDYTRFREVTRAELY